MRISVFTIAFKGYGMFLNRWLRSVQSQTYLPYEIIIVLGEKHGLKEDLSCPGVKVVNYERLTTMGNLRNFALDLAKGDYVFYFSADDVLLGNALRQISAVDAEVIALKYYRGNNICVTPEITWNKLLEWEQHYAAACGYVAFKNDSLRYEKTDWPNYPLLFQAFKKGYSFGVTKEPGAIYDRWHGCHSQSKSNVDKGRQEIQKYLREYGLIKE